MHCHCHHHQTKIYSIEPFFFEERTRNEKNKNSIFEREREKEIIRDSKSTHKNVSLFVFVRHIYDRLTAPISCLRNKFGILLVNKLQCAGERERAEWRKESEKNLWMKRYEGIPRSLKRCGVCKTREWLIPIIDLMQCISQREKRDWQIT